MEASGCHRSVRTVRWHPWGAPGPVPVVSATGHGQGNARPRSPQATAAVARAGAASQPPLGAPGRGMRPVPTAGRPGATERAGGVTEVAVRELARYRGDPAVTSLYLDVNGGHRPVSADYMAAFERLVTDLRRRADTSGDSRLPRAVGADVERMRTWLARDLDRSATRGLGLFSCSDQAFFRAIELPRSVRDRAGFGPAPHVRQLWAVLDESEPFLIALVDRRRLRILRVDLGEVRELAAADDLEPRAIDTSIELGGFQRHDEDLTRAHYRRAAELVERAAGDRPATRLVLGGPDAAVAALEAHLRPQVRHRIVGRAGVRVSAPPQEVAAAARAVAETAERRHEAEMVEQLRQAAAGGHRAVVGLEPTLAAIARGRIATLVVSEDFTGPGARCPSCGWIGADVRLCPTCGTTTVGIDDVVEVAVGEALAHDADVEICRGSDLDTFGRIGALEHL